MNVLLQKKLLRDTVFVNLSDYILTFDITPWEKLERSAKLLRYWVKVRRKFLRVQKSVQKPRKNMREKYFNYIVYLLCFKCICDGREITPEEVSDINLGEFEDFVKKALYKEENIC